VVGTWRVNITLVRKRLSDIPNLEGYGVFVDGLDFAHLARDEWMELGKLHMNKLVMVIRNTGLKRDHFYKVMRAWGRDRQNYAAALFARYPWASNRHELMASDEVTDHEKAILKEYDKIGGNTKGAVLRVTGDGTGLFDHGELLWHSNESGDIAFTPGVALLGDHGMTKSATGFMVTTPYYYSLSDSIRSELDEMVLVHNFQDGKINVEGENNLLYKNMCPEPDTEIPLVIQSPAGIKGLHFPYNTVTGSNNDKLLAEVKRGLEKYTYDYWWENDDDLLIFDNSIVQHRRLGDTSDRLCHRYQFDYTYLQYKLTKKPYMPYLQEPYISRYNRKMDIVSNQFKVFGSPPSCL
tara:strand:+ start:65 stop:1117 length:1053 start_codon:yes stop_codon:yes gene_type:complete